MRALTELEGVALGVVRKRQPCTAYTVRKALQDSPSSHWRASAGSIYPLVKRLQDDGLLSNAPDAGDARGRSFLRVTAKGTRALKAWLVAGAEPDLLAEVFDPLRTRIHFLDALSPAEQLRFAENALGALEQLLQLSQDHLEDRPAAADLFEHLGARGGVAQAESRIEFLESVLSRLRDVT